ncbi:MAG: hypothetical protein AAGE52_32385 [Myxococcota bacterium]
MAVVFLGLVALLFLATAVVSFALMSRPSPRRHEAWLRFALCSWALFTWLFAWAAFAAGAAIWRHFYAPVVVVCISGGLLGIGLFVAALEDSARRLVSRWTTIHHAVVLLVFVGIGVAFSWPGVALVLVPCSIGFALARSLLVRSTVRPKEVHPF